MWYGGDYNPEQWGPETIDEDIRYMKEMHVNCATVGVFAWPKLEPEDGVFDFEWMDQILDRLYKEHIDVILATPTTAMPYWLEQKYPDIMHVDIEGRRVQGGSGKKYVRTAVYTENIPPGLPVNWQNVTGIILR